MGPFLVVDDHSMVREGLGRMLIAEFPGSVIRYAASSQAALEAVTDKFFLLAVGHIGSARRSEQGLMPDIQHRVAEDDHSGSTPMRQEDPFVIRRCGAERTVYYQRCAGGSRFCWRYRKILQGGHLRRPALAGVYGELPLASGPGGGAESLSDREFQILRLITSGKTPTEIADDLGLSVKTMLRLSHEDSGEAPYAGQTAEMIRFGIKHNLDGPG